MCSSGLAIKQKMLGLLTANAFLKRTQFHDCVCHEDKALIVHHDYENLNVYKIKPIGDSCFKKGADCLNATAVTKFLKEIMPLIKLAA